VSLPLGLRRGGITAKVASAAFPPEQGGFHQEFRKDQPLMPFLEGGEGFSLDRKSVV
jgi:hypothetical protein